MDTTSLALPASKQHDRNHPTQADGPESSSPFFSPPLLVTPLEQCPVPMEKLATCPAALLAARHAPELDRPDTGATAIYDRRLVAFLADRDRSVHLDGCTSQARLGQAPVGHGTSRSVGRHGPLTARSIVWCALLAASGEPSRAERPRAHRTTCSLTFTGRGYRTRRSGRAGRAHQVVTGGRGRALACLISRPRPGRLGLKFSEMLAAVTTA